MTKAGNVRDNRHNVHQNSEPDWSLGHEMASAQPTQPRYTSQQPR